MDIPISTNAMVKSWFPGSSKTRSKPARLFPDFDAKCSSQRSVPNHSQIARQPIAQPDSQKDERKFPKVKPDSGNRCNRSPKAKPNPRPKTRTRQPEAEMQHRRDGETPPPHAAKPTDSPPQKRSDGEGPGERPTKWRQAANKIPPRSKAANPRFAADPNSRRQSETNGRNHPTSGFRPRLPTDGTFGAKKNQSMNNSTQDAIPKIL